MSSHQNGNSGSSGTLLDCDGRANLRPYKNPSTGKGPALKNLFQKQNRGVGKDVVMITKTYTINIFIHFLTTESPKILLRGHGPLFPVHPRPPSPRGASRPRNRGLRGLPSAAGFRLGSHGPRPSRRQNPTEGRGEKLSENFVHLKSRSFGICGHSKILPELEEQCGFEDVLMTSSWLKELLPLAFWQSRCHG